MPDFHFDPRTRRETDPEIPEIQKMINYDFDFDGVVAAVFSLLEKKTTLRGCRLSVVGRDFKKRPLLESPAMPAKSRTSRCPLLSYPLPLTNDEIRYTLDVYSFETPQLNRPDSDVLNKCLDLLYQAVNKDYHERDHLTGLYNRQGFLPRMERTLEQGKQEDRPMAVFILDLDHFKNVNDTYGHPVGDLVLFEFASVIADVAAGKGLVGRYGGEEFVVVLPGYDPETAPAVAEEMRAKTEKIKIWVDKSAGKAVSPTCSVGVALFPAHGADVETLVNFADMALYEAKNGGRNRVEVYPLDAPDVRLKKLKETVDTGTLEPLRDLESKCNIITLRERNIVTGLPLAVAVTGSRLFVLDGQAKKVRVYDGKEKKFRPELGGPIEAPDGLEGPVDLAVGSDDRAYVVDAPSHVVKVFEANGAYAGFIGGRDADGAPIFGYVKGAFNEPVAVSLDGEGRVLVAERMNRRAQRFTAAGEFDGLEVPLDAGEVEPTYQPDPRDVAGDKNGNIYILDAGNSVIHKFDAAGSYVRAIGGPGPAADAGRFKGVTALAVDRDGNLASRLRDVGVAVPAGAPGVIVTAEAGDVNRLQFFDVDGTYLGMVDFARVAQKLNRTVRPGRLTVTAPGNIYLVDSENADVVQLSFAGDVY
jgi:diguanylate cyclase (GGDEF)-like protein